MDQRLRLFYRLRMPVEQVKNNYNDSLIDYSGAYI